MASNRFVNLGAQASVITNFEQAPCQSRILARYLLLYVNMLFVILFSLQILTRSCCTFFSPLRPSLSMMSTLRKKMTSLAQHHALTPHSSPSRRRLGPLSWIGCALSAFLCLSNPGFATKANDTLGMAYDQAPENIDPYFNNVRIGVIIAALGIAFFAFNKSNEKIE